MGCSASLWAPYTVVSIRSQAVLSRKETDTSMQGLVFPWAQEARQTTQRCVSTVGRECWHISMRHCCGFCWRTGSLQHWAGDTGQTPVTRLRFGEAAGQQDHGLHCRKPSPLSLDIPEKLKPTAYCWQLKVLFTVVEVCPSKEPMMY